MWKNRLAFALLYAALLVLLLLFSKPFLLATLIVLVVLAALMALLTRRDARLLRTSVRVKSGGREGETVPMTFTFALLAAVLIGLLSWYAVSRQSSRLAAFISVFWLLLSLFGEGFYPLALVLLTAGSWVCT